MKVGDLVKHSDSGEIPIYGIVTEEKTVHKTAPNWPHKQCPITKYRVEWVYGDWGWFFQHNLEAV
jgi:hypothetical protein